LYRLDVDRAKPCGMRATAIGASGNDLLDDALEVVVGSLVAQLAAHGQNNCGQR
jgi:hypothetical protein